MGSNTSEQVQGRSIKLEQHQKKREILIKLPKKACFHYILPILVFDQTIEICDFEKKIQQQIPTNFSKNCKDNSIQIQEQEKTKEIKIKWNTFIKIKQKDYQEEYVILKNVIGKGGFGVIRKVQSKFNGQIRVAKILQKKSMKPEDLAKLMAELHIMKQLDHPNLIKLYEVYDYKNQIILILEICTGGEIVKFTKGKKLSQKKVAKIIKQILRVLIYIHSQKIVHRDIKPQNILFQTDECKAIKIIDFGIAVRMPSEGQYLEQRIGTPCFIAPQIIYKRYNEKCDIWAVGVTMYQMISGKLPFQGQDNLQLMRQILKSDVEFKGSIWSKVSKQCKEVIQLMLKKKIQQRPSANQLFNHPYFSIIQEQKETNNNQEQQQEVFDNIQHFKFKNKLHAVVQTFIASQLLTKQQKHTLIDIFKNFDSNSDGVLSVAQLENALQSRGNISKERLKILIQTMDTNGSGEIDYTQFLVAGFDNDQIITKDRLKKVFQYFDTDHNNSITYDEVVSFLQDYESSQEEIRRLFEQVDKNGNGQISEDEFIQLLLNKAKTIKFIQNNQKPAAKHRIQKISCIVGVNQLTQFHKNVNQKKKSQFHTK